MSALEADFIPGTREISIGRGVVYRPIRSWHSGSFAGERRIVDRGDKSGCIIGELRGIPVTHLPKTVTHRLYWHVEDPTDTISAFLSYPNGMGCCDTYFWEALREECERFGEESELEAWVLEQIGSPLPSEGGDK